MWKKKPLAGIQVLDLSRLVPGPYCTMILSDLGARVVKIEDVQGGDFVRWSAPVRHGMSTMFAALNRDKESVAVNLKTEGGKKIIKELTARSDVVVESFRPGVLDRLGLGFDELKKTNPNVILCSISGYGPSGPYADRPGHDMNYQAMSGLLTAHPDGPQVPGILMADLVGGALWPAASILAALVGARSGTGAQHLEMAMSDGTLSLLLPDLGGDPEDPPATDTFLKGRFAGYNIYRTADGKPLSVGALEPHFWLGLCKALDIDGRADDLGAGEERQQQLKKQIGERIASRTLSEWGDVLAPYCCEPILERTAVESNPQHAHRKMFFEVGDDTTGRFPQVRTPLGSPDDHRSPPRHAQHTRKVLAELGYDEAAVQRLIEEGAIKTE